MKKTITGVVAAGVLGAVALSVPPATAAELVTAEVTASAPAGVTVVRGGGAVTVPISVSATGSISCQVSPANASTARVATSYSLAAGTVSATGLSAPMPFYASSSAAGTSGNCDITWDGATTPYQVPLTFSADAGTTAGSYDVELSAAAGTTTAQNLLPTGGKLNDTTGTTITVHVVDPATPPPSSPNRAPEGTQPADQTGPEGSALGVQGTFTDPDGDALTVRKVTGAGELTEGPNGGWSWSHLPTDNGSGQVTVEASDGKAETAVTFAWTATNVDPTLGALSVTGGTTTACLAGNDVTLDFGFTDPGTADDWIVDVDWGDSQRTTYQAGAQGPQTGTHHFAPGTYTVRVSVSDKDGGTDTASTGPGSVSLLYRASGILAPFNADGSSVWKAGSTIPVKIRVTDCNGVAVGGLAPRVGAVLASSTGPDAASIETASTSAADTTGVMRYDSTAGHYIYNFTSKVLSDPTATYHMRVRGTDAQDRVLTQTAVIQQKFALKAK